MIKFFCCPHLTILLALNFSNFVDSNNPSILWNLKFLLPKAAASAFYCFQISEKLLRRLKYQSSYIFTVSSLYLSLHCNKCYYWIDKGRNFCQQMLGFLYSICIWKYITKIRYEERAFDHFHLRLADEDREVLQIDSIVLLYFEDIWR